MKRVAFLKHLTAHGCQLKREGSEHSIWIHPGNSRQTSIPRHRELSETLIKVICKQLEIPAPH
ncbi:MAG: type II toxin-antitoxin system HicA family toxin [Planctomycetaceae bacterium]|nr:type II toxin-antitoxin system HicA family toxin [Planctomycetaceae bacterium]